MKRKILSGLVGVAMLGAVASANAYMVPLQGHVLNAQYDVAGLGGAAGFTQTLTLGAGDNVSFSGFGGLGGMGVGDFLVANKLYVNGALGYDYTPVTAGNDIQGYFNQLMFSGDVSTTITAVSGGTGLIPTGITNTTSGLTGSFTTYYSGKFAPLPGPSATSVAINSLLSAGSQVSGNVTLSYLFLAPGVLQMTLTDIAPSGWGGFESIFTALDSLAYGGNGDGAINGKLTLNNGVSPTGNFQITAVPEPASLALLGIGIAGLGFMRRRKA